MKIVVCVKFVPDTATKIRIAPGGNEIDGTDVTFVVNPYDEFAVEEALKIREKAGGEVVVVGAGMEQASSGLRTCLAMGADAAAIPYPVLDRLFDHPLTAQGVAAIRAHAGEGPRRVH